MEEPTAEPDLEALSRLRGRIEFEDHILIERTQVVLVLNGLGGIAASLPESPSQAIIGGIIILINLGWVVCAHGSYRLIGELTRELAGRIGPDGPPLPDEAVRQRWHQGRWFPFSSTLFLAVVIPVLLIAGWVICLAIGAGGRLGP